MLTATQEDYVEVIYRLDQDGKGVRITDIAARLGCRLPTVTRTIGKLSRHGLVVHEYRERVKLTAFGRSVAHSILHRHEDLVTLLEMYLGLPAEQAEADTCQIEHGLSPETAQRLHEFLRFLEQLKTSEKHKLRCFVGRNRRVREFRHLPRGKTTGWRG